MRKIYLLLTFIFALCSSSRSQLVISQVYGGGGNASSVYTNDFIEIFNPSTETVSLSGWSVQYASATGGTWQVTALSGSIAPGRYYLVQQAAGTGGTTPLPTADATGAIPMSATAGKVALVNSTTALSGICPTGYIDLVGFGTTANCFETAAAPAPSNTNAIIRANGGCTDNNNNSGDFSTALPNPRNSGSGIHLCGGCTAPANQPTLLQLTPAITEISGSFTAASADGYLVLVSTSAALSQQPSSGNAYAVGATIGNATVVSSDNNTSFNATGLSASTNYFFFVYSYASSGQCYLLTDPLTGSISTNANPAPTVSVAAGDAAAEPATNGSFQLTLSAPAPAGGVVINYALSGSATVGSDYSDPQAGSIAIPEGASAGTIVLNVIDDLIFEATKTINITISGASNGYIVATGSETASINLTDNDVPAAIPLVTSYSQNFNTLASAGTGVVWTDNNTIPGWYASRVVYNASNGGSNAGALYSFGTDAADRALGSIGSGSTGTILYGARFRNNTGTTITSLKITYKGEQWRNAGGTTAMQTVNFSYQSGALLTSLTDGVWTDVPSLNYSSVITGGTAAGIDGNTNAAVVSYTIPALNIAAGDEIMIRWLDVDHSGSDHGLGIDDFIIEANPADLAAPVVSSLSPANGATDVPTNIALSIVFDESIQKGTGNIVLRRSSDNSVLQTIDVNSASVTVNTATVNFSLAALAANTAFYIEVDAGAFEDASGNDFAGIAGNGTWAFTTGTAFYVANFNGCTSALTDGFTQYSTTGAITWACTTFGRDPDAPAGTTPFPNGVQMNGFAGGTNVPNADWLISPSFNLTNTTYPLLSFWSRTAFNGAPLQLKVSTDYNGGDPAAATWTDINGKFPGQASNVWTLSSDINLSAFKQPNVHFAFVYHSSSDDGARWTIDDVSLNNSPTPPPPSLTVSTTDIQFNFVASGSTGDRTFMFIGNDLTGDVTLTATGNFVLSKTGSGFTPSISYTQAEANNLSQTVYVRFAPTQNGQNFEGTVTVSTASLASVINLKGTSIDPATTLEVVNWNVEWFGSTSMEPNNDSQQEQNIKTIMQNIGADVFGLVEVVDEARLASIVSQMPGYSYVICNFGSHTNPNAPDPGPLSDAQKAAFVYKTALFSNISTQPLLTVGINTPEDISNPNYNYWSSGRFPYMMTADVTLNCVTKTIRFVLVHAKANTSPTTQSYERRKNGADALHTLLNNTYPDDNIIILGDFNDDLDQSITAGFTTTSWDAFTTDAVNFSSPTLALSLAGKKSTVGYSDMIDHVMVSNEMQSYYMESSATVLSDVASLVTSYASTTTDHYPIFTRYRFSTPLSPIITSCPADTSFCVSTTGNYNINAFTATDDCGTVTYSYVISGATSRSGTSNNASGAFNAGISTINWRVTDAEGNTATCQTMVTINEGPAATIPDAFALASGTVANTVYIGYAPASYITLTTVATDGSAPYSYSWSNGGNAATSTVSPQTNTTYTVTITDANGCHATAGKQVLVKDIRGGKNRDKVIICHNPSGNNNTLEVSANAVASHLAHGDMLGSCAPTPQYPSLRLTASPNPSSNYFVLSIRGGNPSQPVQVKLLTLLGRTIEQRTVMSGQSVQVGSDYRPGIYFVELTQGREKEIGVLLKLR